jgi:hypothetical protein
MRQPATQKQIAHMSKAFGESFIKLAVDVKREILAGGGELQANYEAVLPEEGRARQNLYQVFINSSFSL